MHMDNWTSLSKHFPYFTIPADVEAIAKCEQDKKENLAYPKYRINSGSWLTFKDIKMPVLHIFGLDANSIPANITHNCPINLKKLYEGLPFQFLHLATAHLREMRNSEGA